MRQLLFPSSDLSSSVYSLLPSLWVFSYLKTPAAPCAVSLTVLCQVPASSSSHSVAIETSSNGKVQASGLSGKKTGGRNRPPRHAARQLQKQTGKKEMGWRVVGVVNVVSHCWGWIYERVSDTNKSCDCSTERRDALTVNLALLVMQPLQPSAIRNTSDWEPFSTKYPEIEATTKYRHWHFKSWSFYYCVFEKIFWKWHKLQTSFTAECSVD